MCYHPIQIRNPRKDDFTVGLDKPYLHVPCGHCHECISMKNDEWYCRAYFEYRDALRLGGFVQFFTLTYSPEVLPTCTSKNYPCFSRSDIQKYLKRVRMRLTRYLDSRGLDGKSIVKGNIRYLITSENGDLYHRPHYHCLFFIQTPALPQPLLKHVLLSSWPSIAYTSKTDDGVINNPLGLRYCCKYITKSDVYMQRLHEARIKMLDENERDEYLKCARPFHLQSLHFGLSAISKTEDGSYLYSECVSQALLEDMKFLVPGKKGLSKHWLPLYYRRHLFYEHSTRVVSVDGEKHYSVRYWLSPYGRSVMSRYVRSYQDALRLSLQSLRSLSPEDMNEFVLFCEERGFWFLDAKDAVANLEHYSNNLSDDFVKFMLTVYDFCSYEDNVSCETPSSLSIGSFYDDYVTLTFEFDRLNSSLDDFCSAGITFGDLFASNKDIAQSLLTYNRDFANAAIIFRCLSEYQSLLSEREDERIAEIERDKRILKKRHQSVQDYNSCRLHMYNLIV